MSHDHPKEAKYSGEPELVSAREAVSSARTVPIEVSVATLLVEMIDIMTVRGAIRGPELLNTGIVRSHLMDALKAAEPKTSE